MYCYIYDKITSEPKHRRLVSEIENRLTDLGLQGEIERVTPIRGLSQCIELSAGRKCSTLVIVGDDSSFSKAITHSIKLDIPVGFIPIKEGVISKVLGIPGGVSACDILSKRKIKQVDLGKVEDNYFLTTAEISLSDKGNFFTRSVDAHREMRVKVNIDSKFDLSTSLLGLKAVNLDPASPESFSVSDGMLNLIMIPRGLSGSQFKGRVFKKGIWNELRGKTVTSFKRASIFGPGSIKVTVDGRGVAKLPVNIEVVSGRLGVIVGASRMIN